MDRRIERTRNLIIDSLSELTKNKKYENITVENIVNKVNVGRNTFYENFQNKGEVFGEILNSLIYHVFNEIQYKDGHAFQRNFKEEIIYMFIHIRDDEGKSRTYLSRKSAPVFYSMMGEKVANICDEKLVNNNKVPHELVHMHISSTFSDVLKYWSKRNFVDTPEKIVEYFLYLAEEVFVIKQY